MNKTDIIAAVAEMNDTSKAKVKEVLDATIETIADSLEAGERVDLAGFGSFTIVERAARKGRNPATGEDIDILATKVVKFKPSKTLKDAVKD